MALPGYAPVRARFLLSLVSLLAVAPGMARGTTLPDGFTDQLVADALSQPVGMAFLPDGRLLVIEQKTARLRLVLDASDPNAYAVGTIPNVNTSGTERGLLGIAVDPSWPQRPYVYVHYTAYGGHVHLSRFTLTGDVFGTGGGALTLDGSSEYVLVGDAPDSANTHNGGSVRFGPDHMLYATIGEDESPCAAQDSASLHGCVLRLDVSRLPDGPGTASRAIVTPADNPYAASPDSNLRIAWAFGLRNPFRMQIDPVNGAVFISDVGENTWEELDRATTGGMDFGWPFREGPIAHTNACGAPNAPLEDPIYAYDRSAVGGGSAVIITAGAYRPGPGAAAFPKEYWGDVFISDFYAGHLWRLHDDGGTWSIAAPVSGQPTAQTWGEGFGVVSDWANGKDGAIWYCRLAANTGFPANTGQIHRIVTLNPAGVPLAEQRVSMAPVHPLPSRGSVRLDFGIARAAVVELAILDVTGARVRMLVPRGRMDPGGSDRAVVWDGCDDAGRAAAPGLYFARLSVDGTVRTRRVVIVR
jgi:glucose/arabinose dehydrogenase